MVAPLKAGLAGLGTVGSADKARLVQENGCDHPILRSDDFVAQ